MIAEGPGRRIFVYPENGKAEELANVLSAALGLPARWRPRRARRNSIARLPGYRSVWRRRPVWREPVRSSGTSGFGSSGFGSQQPFGAYAAAQIPRRLANPPRLCHSRLLEFPCLLDLLLCLQAPLLSAGTWCSRLPRPNQKSNCIVADPATNSLIVYGTAQEFQNIKNILKELDAVPRQVLLDVLVAEVTLTDTERLGLDYEIRPGNTISRSHVAVAG